jgi:hypothetical protein
VLSQQSGAVALRDGALGACLEEREERIQSQNE